MSWGTPLEKGVPKEILKILQDRLALYNSAVRNPANKRDQYVFCFFQATMQALQDIKNALVRGSCQMQLSTYHMQLCVKLSRVITFNIPRLPKHPRRCNECTAHTEKTRAAEVSGGDGGAPWELAILYASYNSTGNVH